MPRLYLSEYRRVLAGKEVTIACREGILRDHLEHVVADIKFLVRQGIRTTLCHNMANRFANRRHFRRLADRLPQTTIHRLPAEADFHAQVLDGERSVFKLIFLERKPLCDARGRRINTLTTRDVLTGAAHPVANTNLTDALDQICRRISAGDYDRVHILPARRDCIKHELFTIEGSGTLIADNFVEELIPVVTDAEVGMVAGILDLYRRQGYLKPRSRAYLSERRSRFFITRIDGIPVGCVERKHVDADTVELAALAISTRFRNQRVGVFTVGAFEREARGLGYRRMISLTNNPRLQTLYGWLGFERKSPAAYADRQRLSPDVAMFVKELGDGSP
jgi:N-acetylglutamate synthase-like GNAT family acetyltransferase